MSSQPSNFRQTDVKRAMQAMQAAGLKVGHVELRGGAVRIIPVNDDDDRGNGTGDKDTPPLDDWRARRNED